MTNETKARIDLLRVETDRLYSDLLKAKRTDLVRHVLQMQIGVLKLTLAVFEDNS